MMALCHRQLSMKYSSVDVRWDIGPILEGDMTQLPPVSSHKIRVFLSSTFSDMTSERNALMEHVYPTLKDFCRKYHLEFQVMDLRWGIREQSHDDHTIIDFCMREIENCKKISLGPNFVILLGQKYGYRPYPPRIVSEEFEKIKHELELKNVSATLLDAWFKKNTNVTPNVYMLQPISSLLPHYAEQDKDMQQRALDEWDSVSSQIQQLLRLGVTYCFAAGKMTAEDKSKYFSSVTEYEIERGLLETEKPEEEVLCFVRQITNLEKNLHQTRARKFIDTVSDGNKVDSEAQNLLQVLKNEKIPAALSDERNSEFLSVSWKDAEHTNPNDDAEYLKRFCSVFQDKMCWLINRCIVQRQSVACNSQVIEILQHLKMGRKLSQEFRGREGTLRKVNLYLRANDDRPLILFGESGSGKTSVIAKVASRMRKWFSELQKNPVVVLRFLGTTSHSCSIRLVLGSICWHIATAYGHDTSAVPGDYPGLVDYFLNLMKVATSQTPLVLLLDGLDQLSSVHRAHNLAWLPKLLPPNVHIILSTLPDKYELLDTLRLYIPNTQNFIEILPLGPQLSINLLKDWLFRSGRDLTAEQFLVVEEALSRCTLPLYTSLVFEEVCRWCSYFKAEEIVLEPTVHAIINKLFDRVEKYHGYIFVSHTLAYLTASKNGLSDMETEDILSLDDEVLNDVFQHWLPPVRRIPPLLIPRLQDELARYILEREANGTIVFYWYHGQFIQVANKRYLSNEVDRGYVHATLAHYYMGTWGGGKKKPYKFSKKMIQNSSIRNRLEGEADRMVPNQPLDYGPDPSDPSRLTYNLRKLSELPYHLIASHQIMDLKNQVLFNYEWLHAKLSAMSLHEVLSDFQQAQDAGIEDADIQLLASALRVGGTHLNQNPDMLAFDLLGRLLCYYDKLLESPNSQSPPVANGHLDSNPGTNIGRFRRFRNSNLQSLLHQCDARSLKHSALIPVLQCFDSPNTMSVYILEGHSKVVTDLVFSPKSNELISVSHERIAFWDLNSGELSRSIYVEDTYPGRKKLYLSENGRYLVVDCEINDAPVHIYDMKTLQLLHSCGARLSTQRRGFLSGSLLCRQKSFIDIMTGSLVKTMDNFVITKTYVTCALSPDNKLILIGDKNETKLFEFTSEVQIAAFEGTNPPSVMAITSDNSRAYIGYAENCQFSVFDIDQTSETFGQLLKMFDPKEELSFGISDENRAFAGNEVSEISLSPVNQNTVLLNINRFYLICFDTVTGSWTLINTLEHCDVVGRPRVYIFCSMFSANGQFILSGIENLLHIWRPDNGELVHTILLQTTPPFPIAVSRNLVATASNVNTAVRVWDLDNIQECKTPKIRAYEAPVDCVSCADQTRLVFVKSQYSLSSMKGFKYMDYFGIDVWNVTTGSCREYLPFAKYGRLLQMKVSVNGKFMALLLNAVDNWYIALIDLKPDGAVRVFKHKRCTSFEVSDSWNFLTSFASGDGLNEIKLWDVNKEKEILSMDNAVCPVFMHDGHHFLFINLGQSASCSSPMIIVYSLQSFVPVCQISCAADSLLPLPRHHLHFLATRFLSGESKTEVSLWKISRKSQRPDVIYRDVGSRGILDVSKDGNFGVDGRLQVYDVFSGAMKACFQGSVLKSNKEYSIVRMTYDGLYVMWIDDMSVKVGHVASGNIVANASAHERLTCLHTMDYGYIIVVGGTDGHLLTMKLAVHCAAQGQVTYRAQSTEDRRYFLLDTSPCCENAISKMDPHFQTRPKFMSSDRELPLARLEVQNELLQLADVPLTVITTAVPSRTGSPFEEGSLFHKRRSSTPISMSHITNVVQSSTLLALLATDDCDSALPQLIGSSSTHNLMNFGTLKSTPCHNKLLQKRSKSAQDLPRLSNPAKPIKLPVLKIGGRKSPGERGNHKKEPRNSKEKITVARDIYRIDRAIEMAGSVLLNCFNISSKEKQKESKSSAADIEECVTSM